MLYLIVSAWMSNKNPNFFRTLNVEIISTKYYPHTTKTLEELSAPTRNTWLWRGMQNTKNLRGKIVYEYFQPYEPKHKNPIRILTWMNRLCSSLNPKTTQLSFILVSLCYYFIFVRRVQTDFSGSVAFYRVDAGHSIEIVKQNVGKSCRKICSTSAEVSAENLSSRSDLSHYKNVSL